ncbi:T9SS type A sorting domain-containing protein [Chryseolinea soli]|uniref:T9SS C-terminal target domain-containing protein n=1 Tax=Chryseolinea soli TaxID=2321403 RepID=A0A385SQR7_9BACT|nr:T9SS type A sorting domain-containing protein [Chryseolinea soli]AYB31860.1 T9SS C-terminal target domain-containing protein [Chryseolinea soli]
MREPYFHFSTLHRSKSAGQDGYPSLRFRATMLCAMFIFNGMCCAAQAQSRDVSLPLISDLKIYQDVPALSLADSVRTRTASTNRAADDSHSPEVGYTFSMTLTPDNAGVWKRYRPDYDTWVLKVNSPGAYGMAALLTDVKLLPGEKLYVYNLNSMRTLVSDDVSDTGVWLTNFLKGDEIVIEFDVPVSNAKRGAFTIAGISHAYRDVFTAPATPNQSISRTQQEDTCYPCVEGTFWQDDRRAVIRIMVFRSNAAVVCTGALINNAERNQRPYVLTAQHCIGSQFDASRSIFTFNYDDLLCDGSTVTEDNALVGANYKASLYEHDFSLVELYTVPPLGFKPYYSGWDISDTGLDHVSCIHHPMGTPRKISLSNDAVTPSDFEVPSGQPRAPDAFWRVTKWDLGVTNGGSSGAPLFNLDHHIIGSLAGGGSTCSFPFNDFFQRLSQSWTPAPELDQQLKYWLDPRSSGIQTLDGFDPYETLNVSCDTAANFSAAEPMNLIPYASGKGYFSGYNSDGIASYAERFSSDGKKLLTGITLLTSSLNVHAPGGLVVSVNSGKNGLPEGTDLFQTYIPYIQMSQEVNYVGLHPYLEVEGDYFITYTMTYSEEDTFALAQAPWRAPATNTAYVKLGSGWAPMTQISPGGMGTSLGIEAMVCSVLPSGPPAATATEIDLYPNPTTATIIARLPLHGDVPFDAAVYNPQGRLVASYTRSFDNNLIISTEGWSGGLYILRVSTSSQTYSARFVKN